MIHFSTFKLTRIASTSDHWQSTNFPLWPSAVASNHRMKRKIVKAMQDILSRYWFCVKLRYHGRNLESLEESIIIHKRMESGFFTASRIFTGLYQNYEYLLVEMCMKRKVDAYCFLRYDFGLQFYIIKVFCKLC